MIIKCSLRTDLIMSEPHNLPSKLTSLCLSLIIHLPTQASMYVHIQLFSELIDSKTSYFHNIVIS